MNPFQNIQVDIDSLPSQEVIQFQKLEKNYLTVRMIGLFIFWTIVLIAYFVALRVGEDGIPAFIRQGLPFVLSTFAVISFLLALFGVKRKEYAMRARDILYKKGLFWKSNTTVPFSRIQHCEVKQGPIERMFNLSSLRIYTAGGSSSDLSIPGLQPTTAQSMKSYVLQKIKSEEEE